MAGIDLGNMNCYLAVARNKGIDILINDYSLHATPSCVTFGNSARLMGFGARQQMNVHFKNTVINFKHLLGHEFTDSVVQFLRTFIPCEVIQLSNNQIGFKVMHLGNQCIFTPIQIMACLFTHLRQLFLRSTNTEVTECVLNVPYFYTERQRLELLTAGKIAGLNFRLINDHTALAFNYGIYKASDLPKLEEQPKLVAFVDCGHSGIQASLVTFNTGRAKILSAVHDLSVGGIYFDALLRDHFTAIFKDKYKIDSRQNPRSWLRLLDECEKLKKQMSANSQNIPFHIECFMDDVDVNGSMQRDQFEQLAEPLFKKLPILFQQLIQLAQVKIEDIADVELIGGSCRMPRIKQITSDFFKKEPRTTMNLDDAVARGCALQCATFYPVYQMKEFVVVDPFEVQIDNTKLPKEEELVNLLNAEQEMQAADQRNKERSDTKNALEEYCFKVQHAVEDENLCKDRVNHDERHACISECQKALDWLDMESDLLQKKQIESRHAELEKFCAPTLAKLYAVAEAKNNKQEQTVNGDANDRQQSTPKKGKGKLEEANQSQEMDTQPVVEEPLD